MGNAHSTFVHNKRQNQSLKFTVAALKMAESETDDG